MSDNIKHQCWIAVGDGLGKVSGSYEEIKAVQKIIFDGEAYRAEIRRLKEREKELEGSIDLMFDSCYIPRKRASTKGSSRLSTAAKAIRRLFLFGGKS